MPRRGYNPFITALMEVSEERERVRQHFRDLYINDAIAELAKIDRMTEEEKTDHVRWVWQQLMTDIEKIRDGFMPSALEYCKYNCCHNKPINVKTIEDIINEKKEDYKIEIGYDYCKCKFNFIINYVCSNELEVHGDYWNMRDIVLEHYEENKDIEDSYRADANTEEYKAEEVDTLDIPDIIEVEYN